MKTKNSEGTEKRKEKLSVETTQSLSSFLVSYSRPCEIFSLLFFLQFREFLDTASNKQEDLMMNSGKSRISWQIELREMRFQKCLSHTILY